MRQMRRKQPDTGNRSWILERQEKLTAEEPVEEGTGENTDYSQDIAFLEQEKIAGSG